MDARAPGLVLIFRNAEAESQLEGYLEMYGLTSSNAFGLNQL